MSVHLEQDFEMHPKGVEQLVPPFIQNICKKPQSVELRVSYDAPTMQSTYTYTVVWEEDDRDQEREYRAILERMEKMGTKSGSDIRGAPPPVAAVCDGPCKKTFPSNLLNTMGRCGHYLCVACFGIVKNSDGTNGCSAAHCNWIGESRKEAKEWFEKEICQKQRVRAREMKDIGVDVKSASTVSSSSSRTNSMKSSPVSSTTASTTISTTTTSSAHSDTSGETDCSVPRAVASSKFQNHRPHLIFPSKQEIIGVKLFILEEMMINGRAHRSSNIAELEFASSILAKNAITSLVIQKFKGIPMNHHGVLYHVELTPNMKRRVYRVHSRDYMSKALFEFSQIAEHIVFVLDFDGYLKEEQEVSIG